MADDPVLVVDRRVLDVMVEVLKRLRVEDDDGDRLPDLAVLPVQKLGHEIGVTVGRLGERRRLAPAEALAVAPRSEEHTSELQSRLHLVCRLLLEKKKKKQNTTDKDGLIEQRD